MTHSWLPASLNNTRKWGWREIDIWKAKKKKNPKSSLYLLIPQQTPAPNVLSISQPLTPPKPGVSDVKPSGRTKKQTESPSLHASEVCVCVYIGGGGSAMKDAVDSMEGWLWWRLWSIDGSQLHLTIDPSVWYLSSGAFLCTQTHSKRFSVVLT